jgi:hypothetical protein
MPEARSLTAATLVGVAEADFVVVADGVEAPPVVPVELAPEPRAVGPAGGFAVPAPAAAPEPPLETATASLTMVWRSCATSWLPLRSRKMLGVPRTLRAEARPVGSGAAGGLTMLTMELGNAVGEKVLLLGLRRDRGYGSDVGGEVRDGRLLPIPEAGVVDAFGGVAVAEFGFGEDAARGEGYEALVECSDVGIDGVFDFGVDEFVPDLV